MKVFLNYKNKNNQYKYINKRNFPINFSKILFLNFVFINF